MNGKEHIKIALAHKESDRIPITDWIWKLTAMKWKDEGIPDNMSVDDFFEFEMAQIVPDVSPQYPYKIIEEDEQMIKVRNFFGVIIKEFKDFSTTPQIIESPVKNRNDWELLKKKLIINDSRLISIKNVENPGPGYVLNWQETLKEIETYNKKGRFVSPLYITGFEMIQRYLGMEKLLVVMATEPDWAKDMFLSHAKFVINLHEFLEEKGLKCDGVLLGNDMGYRNSSLFSPIFYKELILPSDKLMCDYFHSKNLSVFLHSCGNIKDFIPLIIEAGFDCINPLEAKAKMDLIDLKQKFGDKLSFWGGINTMLYSSNNISDLENEIKSKLEVAKKGGDYIYSCDHSVPSNVSLAQYKRIIELVKKYGKYK